MPDSALHIELDRPHNRIYIRGALNLRHFSHAESGLRKAFAASGKETIIDLAKLTNLDTAGAFLLYNTTSRGLKFSHIRPEHKALLELVANAKPGKPPTLRSLSSLRKMLVRIGKTTMESWPACTEFITFTGRACIELAKVFRHPARLRLISITHHIEAIGIDAIPIISMIAFVISVVIAYQGQAQLKPLGVEQYTVNLMAISVLREMGVLLTAIMIAGRSGSAFTAEIGTMQVREEVDALRAIGLDPFELLVVPRLIALIIVLPLLTFLADAVGLFGGALISSSLLDISLPQYMEQVRHAATWKDFFVGMIKAPVFAFVIALVGCMHGLKVSGSSESVGRETTASVVKSIFLVLILDGLFSIYFQKVGL